MQARLYLNLGITKEQISEVDEAVNYYETAIKICKSNDLFEMQHKCLMAIGFLNSLKKDDSNSALNMFNRALEVAKRIQDKNEKTCETLLAKSSILIQNGDYQSAKQVLKKAFRHQTPNQVDKEAIQSKLKTGELCNPALYSKSQHIDVPQF
jgi:tetratricopeptide (TPR) repeat protein